MISGSILKAKELLLSDQMVGLPTETVYGLAASIHSPTAIEKIFKIKERPFFDPLIVHISNLQQLSGVCLEFPNAAKILAKAFWPGPLTLVLPKDPRLNPMITSGLETVGVRMPQHPMALQLIEACGTPLAAPSANKFGKTSPTSAEHVARDFRNEDLFVLDGGLCEVGIESTVLSISESTGKTRIQILRPGFITAQKIRDALQNCGELEIISLSDKSAPGHLAHHYQPDKPLVLIEGGVRTLESSEVKSIRERLNLEGSHFTTLELGSAPEIVARSIYSQMRKASQQDVHFIAAFKSSFMHGDDWAGILDRLKKAASLYWAG